VDFCGWKKVELSKTIQRPVPFVTLRSRHLLLHLTILLAATPTARHL
jgi:hypothetical protein